MGCRTSQHNGASFSSSYTRELDEPVLSNKDFLNNIAVTKLDELRMVKGGGDFTTSNKGQSLDTIEISMFNGHDSGIWKQLFRPVVDQLSVDKAGNVVSLDLIYFLLHLVLFSTLKFGELTGRVYTDTGTKNLDLVCVHGWKGGLDVKLITATIKQTLSHPIEQSKTNSTNLRVLAIRILAFSILFGWFTPIFLSKMNPSARYESTSFPPAFLMIWILSRLVEPLRRSTASTARLANFSLSTERTLEDRVVFAMLIKSSRNLAESVL